ncbi:MAG: single-stranded DNA-binding protein [Candidatus Kerfeldbacteria bacterium CG08_land_8_20_14_0_20_42_7]|uniref:Single-stranded DNA-binding protein n=1 Tax=Candidatus Kerfeldbacteria bacterium CG08_land_8_20_14_0_20_42_7 TaxID=2014245 RepID=A0A2H0YU04_9BACT|nr:MAG: single-stranded DNA-binding protein [Candidatus Kerfeldbacteria bacterium CG08_land_8_20_14_0_20_42_7]
MAMNLNKVQLIGNLTRDPEIRTTPTGQNVASFSVATSRRWTDKEGQSKEQTEFHNLVAWRKLADIIGQYVKKGSKVYVEGHLQTRNWEDQQGAKKYRTEIIVDNLIMLDRKGESGGNPFTGNADNSTAQPEPTAEHEINVEDIPF